MAPSQGGSNNGKDITMQSRITTKKQEGRKKDAVGLRVIYTSFSDGRQSIPSIFDVCQDGLGSYIINKP